MEKTEKGVYWQWERDSRVNRATWQELWHLVKGVREPIIIPWRGGQYNKYLSFLFLPLHCRNFPLAETNQTPEGKTIHCCLLWHISKGTGEGTEATQHSTDYFQLSTSSLNLSNKGQTFIPNCLLDISTWISTKCLKLAYSKWKSWFCPPILTYTFHSSVFSILINVSLPSYSVQKSRNHYVFISLFLTPNPS